jgi:hypothetical protein
MTRKIVAFIPICLLALLCLTGFFAVKHVLQLPFRATNDALHKSGSVFTLDFLIPGGVYLDDSVTVGEVVKIRFKADRAFYEKWIDALFKEIPNRYRYCANLVLFLFWSFLFMTFFRVFTFMGYGRALRSSLLLGGLTYYFMPDLSVSPWDDIFFLGIPILIILLRTVFLRGRKRGERQ